MAMLLLLPLLPTALAADNVLVRPWGENALRVQVAPASWTLTDQLPTAYLPGGAPGATGFGSHGFGSALPRVEAGPVTSGNIKAEVGADGMLSFTRVSDSKVLFKETARTFSPPSSGASSSVTFDFTGTATKLYGMGQNRQDQNGPGMGVNVVGHTYDFQKSISYEGGPSNSLPWVLGADPKTGFQFGLLFNSPSLGGAVHSATNMTWSIAGDAGNQQLRQQFDFLITTHSADAKPEEKPFQMMEKYVDAVGHARKMPWPGYWHSRNRYASQEELLTAARGFHNRSVPVDVIVIDWFHWKIMGDWSFDESKWPDPKAMVDECRSYGMEIMVSVWAFTCPGSRSYDMLVNNSWVTTYVGEDGERTNMPIETHGKNCHLVDPTTEPARKYVWSLIESGYYQYGIKIFWLDASEPEGFGPLSTNASWAAGDMRDMGSMFTLYWTQAFYDGLQGHGEEDIVMLPRAGWVGTWRHGAVLWSGDIGSTMEVLKSQVNIGISAQTSAIPWWTTDVGGYSGGHAEDPVYHETVGRWFQYGMTCPLLRQHGARDHTCPWFYGPETEKIIEDVIKLRHAMKPYYTAELNKLNETGRPFNRPLMWDFPGDPRTWELAENGIGDKNMTNQPSADVKNGDFVVLKPCVASSPMQTFKEVGDNIQLGGKCVDSGGAPGGQPPDGPYPVHMWQCASHWAGAQSWKYDSATKSITQTHAHRCLSTGTDGHPALAACSASDKTQQWTITGAGAIESGSGSCLTVEPASTNVGGVIDQYMMGDDYMAAPVLNLGQRAREVYFPIGADWTHHYTGKVYKGGTTEMVPAPLNEFPLFKKTTSQ